MDRAGVSRLRLPKLSRAACAVVVALVTVPPGTSSAADDKVQPVVITNTPLGVNVLNSPSVTVSNTPSVNVANTPAVTIANTPDVNVVSKERRIQAKMVFSLAEGVSQQQSGFTIPVGKRLLVDQIAVYARVPDTAQTPAFFVYTAPYTECVASNPSCPIDAVTPTGSTGLRMFPPADKSGLNHAETQTINLFSERSISIEYSRLGAAGTSFAWVIVTGRLVDKPAE